MPPSGRSGGAASNKGGGAPRETDVERVADELYGLAPPAFTAAREARARAARDAGDRELAAAIKALRKPTAAAWAVNLLRRHRGDELEELLGVGEALRRAQARLAGDELRQLSQRRQAVVARLAREADRLTREAGHPAGAPAIEEVVQTLEAALADDKAAREVRGGRLTGGLRYAGMGLGEHEPGAGALGQARSSSPKAPARGRAPTKAARPPSGAAGRATASERRDQAAARRRAEHEAAAEERRAKAAGKEAAAAERELEAAKKALARAEADVERRRAAVSEAKRRASAARAEREAAARSARRSAAVLGELQRRAEGER